MNSNEARDSLRAILLEHSIKTGVFTLASGQTSNLYVDVRKTALRADGARCIGRLLTDLVSTLPDVHGVGGMTLGADPILGAITLTSSFDGGELLHSVIVRKETKTHGTEQFLESAGGLDAPKNLVAVDDVITTAGSTITAIERLRNGGYEVRDAVCVVDRDSRSPKSA